MKTLIALSIRRPIGTLMFFLAVTVLGILSALNLPLTFLPSLSIPKLTVLCSYGGSPRKR